MASRSTATTWAGEDTRSATYCVQLPGALPRSTTRVDGRTSRNLRSICSSLKKDRALAPPALALRTYGSFFCRLRQLSDFRRLRPVVTVSTSAGIITRAR